MAGNPVAAAAAVATVRLASDPRVLARNRELGEYFIAKGLELKARHPTLVKDARGRGLLLGVELTYDARTGGGPAARARRALPTWPGRGRCASRPSFLVTREELDEGLRVLEDAVVALAPPA